MNYTVKISDFLSDLADMFSGNYSHDDAGINELREEVLDISFTPNTYDDKEVLKQDFNTFLKDTKKAQNSLKKKVLQGSSVCC